MRISHRNRFVFISIPKNASTSIRVTLSPHSDIESTDHYPYYHHVEAGVLRKHFARQGWDWNDYFKFAVVRDPWERTVSQYRFLKGAREFGLESSTGSGFEAWCLGSRDRYEALRRHPRFLPRRLWASAIRPYRLVRRTPRWPATRRLLRQFPNDGFLRHLECVWQPQLAWITDDDGTIIVDRVLRADRLKEEWRDVASRLHLPERDLPRLAPDWKPITEERPDHRALYSDRTVQVVADRFRDDIEEFGFTFT